MESLTAYPLILTEGGDDRLVLNPQTGVNKYFCKPEYTEDVIFRGSCTCNLPSKLGYEAAQNAYEALKSGEATIDSIMEDARSRLLKAYNLPEGTGVFLTPSGSDAEYIPLMFCRIFNGNK